MHATYGNIGQLFRPVYTVISRSTRPTETLGSCFDQCILWSPHLRDLRKYWAAVSTSVYCDLPIYVTYGNIGQLFRPVYTVISPSTRPTEILGSCFDQCILWSPHLRDLRKYWAAVSTSVYCDLPIYATNGNIGQLFRPVYIVTSPSGDRTSDHRMQSRNSTTRDHQSASNTKGCQIN